MVSQILRGVGFVSTMILTAAQMFPGVIPGLAVQAYASLSLSGSTIQQACFSTTFHPIRKPVISFHQVSSVKSCVLFGVLNIFSNFAFK